MVQESIGDSGVYVTTVVTGYRLDLGEVGVEVWKPECRRRGRGDLRDDQESIRFIQRLSPEKRGR